MSNRQKKWEDFCDKAGEVSFKKITAAVDKAAEFFIINYYLNSTDEPTEEDIQHVFNKYFINIQTQILSAIIDKLKTEKQIFDIKPELIKDVINNIKEDPSKWGYEKIINTDAIKDVKAGIENNKLIH